MRVVRLLDVLNFCKQNSLVVLEVLQAQCLLWDQLDPKYTEQRDQFRVVERYKVIVLTNSVT